LISPKPVYINQRESVKVEPSISQPGVGVNQTTILIAGALTGIGRATDMLDRFVSRNEAAKAGFLGSVPAKCAATVHEIAEAIVLIASAKAPYLTGQWMAATRLNKSSSIFHARF
jgi:hypothetical protein